MIHNGRTGYLSGDLTQPAGTVLAMTKGPIKGRNWHAEAAPMFWITMSVGATGTVALEGTNDVSSQDTNDPGTPIERNLLPTDDAVWAAIAGPTSASMTGTVASEFEFLRLILVAEGDGYVLNAGVRWS